jgi:hypothetical protein
VVNPVFGADIEYRPFETTALTLAAGRTVANSLFGGQITVSTGVNLSLTQRLFGWLYFSAGAGYNQTAYTTVATTTETPLVAGRTDNVYSFNTRLSTSFWKHGTFAVFYSYTDDLSNLALYSFKSQQFGGEIGFAY